MAGSGARAPASAVAESGAIDDPHGPPKGLSDSEALDFRKEWVNKFDSSVLRTQLQVCTDIEELKPELAHGQDNEEKTFSKTFLWYMIRRC